MSFNKSYKEILYGGILKEPGTCVANKTGGWRNLKPIIDEETCILCKRCWMFCPDGIIRVNEKSVTIDYDYCKGCGLCAEECPKDAIKMEVEVK